MARGAWLLFLTLAPGCYQAHELGVDAGPRPDLGALPDDGVVSCHDEVLPAGTGIPCSDAVSACRSRCDRSDEPCRDACLDMPCRECIYRTVLPCANDHGCQDRWHDFACCADAAPECTSFHDLDRIRCAPRCPAEWMPYEDCINRVASPDCFLLAARECHLE